MNPEGALSVELLAIGRDRTTARIFARPISGHCAGDGECNVLHEDQELRANRQKLTALSWLKASWPGLMPLSTTTSKLCGSGYADSIVLAPTGKAGAHLAALRSPSVNSWHLVSRACRSPLPQPPPAAQRSPHEPRVTARSARGTYPSPDRRASAPLSADSRRQPASPQAHRRCP